MPRPFILCVNDDGYVFHPSVQCADFTSMSLCRHCVRHTVPHMNHSLSFVSLVSLPPLSAHVAPPLIVVAAAHRYAATGLQTVARALSEFADVLVVAPASNQSAKSMSLSLGTPLEVLEHTADGDAFRVFSVSGTPVDCVIAAFHHMLPQLKLKTPDLVVSGINHGGNLGADVMVSGTVGAAMYASLHYAVPSVAASVVFHSATSQPTSAAGRVKETLEFGTAAPFVAAFCQHVLAQVAAHPFLNEVTFNINVPNTRTDAPPPSTYRLCSSGVVNYVGPALVPIEDKPNTYFLGGVPAFADIPGSDCDAVVGNVIAVTPLAAGSPAGTYREELDRLGPMRSSAPAFEASAPAVPAPATDVPEETMVLKRSRMVQPSALLCPRSVEWLHGHTELAGFTALPSTVQSPAAAAAAAAAQRSRLWEWGVAALAGAVLGVAAGHALATRR